ncbi:hypothetical protein ACS0TY_034834 [Phlomoides rotata]
MMLYAAAWTVVLTAMVRVASFLPKWSFILAINLSFVLSLGCNRTGTVRLLLDIHRRTSASPLDFSGEQE